MSDVFDLPVKASQLEVYGANSNEAISFDEIENAAAHAINNHDKLVELLEYFYRQPVDLMQAWPAGHIAKQNEAISLLKELGHDI